MGEFTLPTRKSVSKRDFKHGNQKGTYKRTKEGMLLVTRGRNNTMTAEVLVKIKEAALSGLPEKAIAQAAGIPYGTLLMWKYRNYLGFGDKFKVWQYGGMKHKAERNVIELLDEKKDKRVKSEITRYTLDRLGKTDWASRTEVTGPNGGSLFGLAEELRKGPTVKDYEEGEVVEAKEQTTVKAIGENTGHNDDYTQSEDDQFALDINQLLSAQQGESVVTDETKSEVGEGVETIGAQNREKAN